MKSMLNKMLILMIGISVWAVYLNRDKIQSINLSQFVDLIPVNETSAESTQPIVSKVFKWKDENGELHFTNKPPRSTVTYEELRFRLDENSIAPPQVQADHTDTSQHPKQLESNVSLNESLFQKAAHSIKDARQIESQLQHRQKELDQIMNQTH